MTDSTADNNQDHSHEEDKCGKDAAKDPDSENRDEREESRGGDSKNGKDKKEENQRSGVLEILFSIFSCGVLLFLIGYLIYQIAQENTPPVIEITESKPRPRGAYTAIMITVRNDGDDAAKAVQIRGEAPMAGKDAPYEAEGSLDWLPGNSVRQVTLLFPPDVNIDDLEVYVVGYEEP